MASHVYPSPASTRSGTTVKDREDREDTVEDCGEPVRDLDERIALIPTVAKSVLVEPAAEVPLPRTGISPLAGRGSIDRPGGSTLRAEPPASPVPVEEPEALNPGPRPSVSSRFDFVSVEDEALPATAPRSRRLVQGAIALALVTAAVSLMVVLPDAEDGVAAAGQATERIETDAAPVASSELLTAAASPEVDGTLQSLASTGRLSRANIAPVPAAGTPGDGGDGFATAVAEAVAEVDAPPERPTTTTWTEPALPPESQWVDSGNGVMVPDLLLRIRFCESTNNYKAANRSSSARGAYQFLNKSWDWYGHAATTGVSQAHLATPAQQDQAALATLKAQGTAPWAESRSCWADENIDPRYATAKPQPPAPAPTTTTSPDAGSSTTAPDGSSTSTSDGSATSSTDTTVQDQTTTTSAGQSTTSVDSSTTSESTSSTTPTTQPTSSTSGA